MGINIGFTGTRKGMTTGQMHALRRELTGFCAIYDTVYFHEGEGLDRDGKFLSADMQAKKIAEDLSCIIVPHPPADNTAKALLARNDIIVARCSFLIAAPGGYYELARSGTWATIRRGRNAQRDGEIIWPCACIDHTLSATRHDTH